MDKKVSREIRRHESLVIDAERNDFEREMTNTMYAVQKLAL